MLVFDGNSMYEKYSASCPRCLQIKKEQHVIVRDDNHINPDVLPSDDMCRACMQHKRILEATEEK
jgi:hypothetical protein